MDNNMRGQVASKGSNVRVQHRFPLMREPVLANYTRIYHSIIEHEGSEAVVKARLRNAYAIHKSWGVYDASDSIGRHFSNWSIARPQDFSEFCSIILNVGGKGMSIPKEARSAD